TFVVLRNFVLYISYDATHRNLFADIILKILELSKRRITEIFEFVFIIVKRMTRNVNPDNLLLASQLLHRSPLLGSRNNRLRNLYFAHFAKQTHLRIVLILFVFGHIANHFCQKRIPIRTHRKVLRSVSTRKTLKSSRQS